MKELPDITVIFATYNRAAVLERTLEGMAQMDLGGFSAEVVVVDNNSSDHTRDIVESFRNRLPIRYLIEERPGKNRALNKALKEVELGSIIVFTDDDIDPPGDWLKSILGVSRRWPDCKVFGGSVLPVFPEGDIPGWTRYPFIQWWCYAMHRIADYDKPYPPGQHPSGPNFWVRREVFAGGRLYDESMGPTRGNKFPMGSEASFLLRLAREGFEMIYSPDVAVGHRVQSFQLRDKYVVRRAYRHGLGLAFLQAEDVDNLSGWRMLPWLIRHIAAWLWHKARRLAATFVVHHDYRIKAAAIATQRAAYHLGLLKVAYRRLRNPCL